MKTLLPLALTTATFCLSLPGTLPAADYLLAPGDTVEIAIARLADRPTRSTIQLDGTISLPEAGAFAVAGMTVRALQEEMKKVLPTKLFHLRLANGSERIVVVRPDEISVSVAEYRPVYVTGDVLTPGQQTFRPRMTARQAIAVAGGYSLFRKAPVQSGFDPVEAAREYQSLWIDFTGAYFQRERIRAELSSRETFAAEAPSGSPLATEITAAAAGGEAKILALSLEDAQRQKHFLETAIADADAQIDVLSKREAVEAEGVKADEEELQKITALFKAGNLTNNRLSDARRALLLSSTRQLDTSVELLRMRRQKAEYARQIEQLATQRQLALTGQLKDVELKLADLGARIETATAKLRNAGSVKPSIVSNLSDNPRLTVVRNASGTVEHLAIGEDDEVMPGDVIEIALGSPAPGDVPVR